MTRVAASATAAFACSLVLALAGCGGGNEGAPPDEGVLDGGVDSGVPDGSMPDAGQPDAGQPDAGQPDAGLDGGTPDAGVLDAGQPDAGLDGGTPDAGQPDAGLDGGMPDGGVPTFDCVGVRDDIFVPCEPGGTPCTGGNFVSECLPSNCGGSFNCLPTGGTCADEADCSPGVECNGAFCNADAAAPCLTSKDCTPGFACVTGSCVDRRIPCSPADPDIFPCPRGYYCRAAAEQAAYCAALVAPCGTQTECDRITAAASLPAGALLCTDGDGDGTTECVLQPIEAGAACNAGGQGTCDLRGATSGVPLVCRAGACVPTSPLLCSDATGCNAGDRCVDVWGDGRKTCVGPDSDCDGPAACPEGTLCGVPRSATDAVCN